MNKSTRQVDIYYMDICCMLVVNEIEFKDCRVEWFALDAVYFCLQKSPRIYRTISRALRFTRSSGSTVALIHLLSVCVWTSNFSGAPESYASNCSSGFLTSWIVFLFIVIAPNSLHYTVSSGKGF